MQRLTATALLLLLLLLLLLAGCSSTGEYTCPEPIGAIIRDDCSVYRTRYESLAVELKASVGPAGGSVSAGQQKLRDPSELLQLLMHQTLALCKDFNTCRVRPFDYRKRREELDRKYTAITGLTEQLREERDQDNRDRLVKALIEVLTEGMDRGPREPAGLPVGARCKWDKECAPGLGCCHACTSRRYEHIPGRSYKRVVPGRPLPWGRCGRHCFPCR